MNTISVGSFILRAVGTFVAAFAGWAVLGYLATAPLGAIYGWSGHPSIPAAPVAVYVGVFLVVLPIICLFGAWRMIRWIEARIRGVENAGA
jgi:hypothetical protein